MKTCNSKARNGGWAAGLLTIGLPVVAAVIIMGGCSTFQALFPTKYVSLAITPPAKTVFGQGEEFTYEGLQVAGVTKKGETKDLSSESFLVTGYDPDRVGEQAVTVNYNEVTGTYTVTVIGVESIAIDQAPTAAKQGLDIDRGELRVTASYGDKIPPRSVQGDKVNFPGYNKDGVGAQTVTAEYYGKTATFNVTVAALTGIKITKQPARVSYFSGESLELAGLEVTGTWQGAGDAPVTAEYVSGFDSGAQGSQTVIVEALGKQTSFTVTVKEPSDPTTWMPVQGVFAKNVIDVLYGNGKFVALGYDDKPEEKIIAYSTDGITWTKAPSQVAGLLAKNIIGMVYGNGKFVVAGYPDDKNEGYVSDKVNESIIAYSTDGITWTKAATPKYFRNIAIFFGNDRFVTIGNYRYQQTGTDQWTISYYQVESSDGINWSDRTILSGEEDWERGYIAYVFFDGSKFVARGGGGQYLSSTDNGKSWKKGENVDKVITNMVTGNGKMIGHGPTGLVWSTDGIIWTRPDQNEGGDVDLNDLAYGFGMFAAAGSWGSIIYSRDGYTWAKVAVSTFGSTYISHIVYGNGRFVAIGTNGRVAYSNKID